MDGGENLAGKKYQQFNLIQVRFQYTIRYTYLVFMGGFRLEIYIWESSGTQKYSNP